MTSEYEIIHARVYNPAAPSIFKLNRNDRAECTTVRCRNAINCGLFARGECATLGILGGMHCPYGNRSTEEGYTSKARAFGPWIKERREKYEGKLDKLKTYSQKMAIVGDHIFLPYSFMNMNESVPFLAHGGAMRNGSHFMLREQFTGEVLLSIVDFVPRALFGGVIKDYQEKEVPKFLSHLKKALPDMYAFLQTQRPEKVAASEKATCVGRRALVTSLKPGTVVTKYHNTHGLSTQHWTWDGVYLTSTDAGLSFPITEYAECTIRIKPNEGAIVEISNDDQVDDDTEFVD